MARRKVAGGNAAREALPEHRPADHPRKERDPEGLVGESEYNTEEAGDRDPTRRVRVPGGAPERQPLSSSYDELGRRFLEDATESPGRDENPPDQDPIEDLHIEDPEQLSAAVEAGEDRQADPINDDVVEGEELE